MVRLSDSFVAVSVKRLSAVETDRYTSNQHEFNGTAQMRQHLGNSRKTLAATFIYLGADETEHVALNEMITWYDAREQHPYRSEYRLYFHDNEVMACAREGDTLVTALRHDGTVLLLVVARTSEDLPLVLWLFGVSAENVSARLAIDPRAVAERPLSVSNEVAELIGIESALSIADACMDDLISRFGEKFPSTRELSDYARDTLSGEMDATANPDGTLIQLMDREEFIFRQIERYIVSKKIAVAAPSWTKDVDAFVSFSLSVQNRRKSRAGAALENHVDWILRENGIRFDHGVVTEGHSKPDFLFPGALEYHNKAYPTIKLTMLGAKTSCKDRWRQVLNEAARIEAKHLLTLQPAISVNQTDEMQSANLQLVIPKPLHSGYSTAQQKWLVSLHEFIELVRRRE